MRKIFCLLFLFPAGACAHPGIGILRDSKGNIFYTDLEQVWKITKGIKTIAVRNVHTHELFLDAMDNLYGEHLRYESEATDRFFHYMWKLTPDGRLDTIVNTRQAYIKNDFSLAGDLYRNSYYISHTDSSKIFKIHPDGRETLFANGRFTGVKFLHVQEDGSILFVLKNDVFRINSTGVVKIIAENIVDDQISIWSVWQDESKNIYASVFSEHQILKIDALGKISVHHISENHWSPVHGVFDGNNQLWVLEYSDKNEARVVNANLSSRKKNKMGLSLMPILLAVTGIASIILFKAFGAKKIS